LEEWVRAAQRPAHLLPLHNALADDLVIVDSTKALEIVSPLRWRSP